MARPSLMKEEAVQIVLDLVKHGVLALALRHPVVKVARVDKADNSPTLRWCRHRSSRPLG